MEWPWVKRARRKQEERLRNGAGTLICKYYLKMDNWKRVIVDEVLDIYSPDEQRVVIEEVARQIMAKIERQIFEETILAETRQRLLSLLDDF